MLRKVLIVDDNAINRAALKGTLGKDYDVLEAENGEKALEALAEQDGISAVLLDIAMPVLDGYEVLRRMRDNVQTSQIPVIMVTGSEDEQARVKAISMGANDFVTKPYNPDIIMHCLRNNISLHEIASKINAMQRDKLTGLYSRDAFFEKAEELIAAQEAGYYIMASFDIDNFKLINDKYGSKKGDEILCFVANAFQEGFSLCGGVCCRIAGDDFAVLYPQYFVGTRELAELRRKATVADGMLPTPLGFSIGRYLVNDLSLSASTMFDRASLARLTAKGSYDANIAQYDEKMREELIRNQYIVGEMDKAVSQRQFEVWFQPQYNHASGAIVGAEALVRWRHPERGLIPPKEFIPVFEQNGFVYKLDKYVWEETCRYLRKWLDEGRSPLPVSVNISRYDVFSDDVVEVISGIVEKYKLPRELLRLEITESAFAKSADQIISVVNELVVRGFTVEIDDFGSGYSSLNTLKDVPAQIIKLDMRFLETTENSQRGGNIVESVVRMAKWLGIAVLAEGVETMEQADFLKSIGCNYVQGYLYSKPMQVEEYEALCANAGKEEKLITLETVENMDNNAFWDPESMDTLIFNSYVGGACIYEYRNGNIELLRANEKYSQVIGSAGMTIEDALKLDWIEHLDEKSRQRVIDDLQTSVTTKREVTGEYVFVNLPGCPNETYLRSTMRVIASAGDRYLIYCTNENLTAQRLAEKKQREAEEKRLAAAEQLQAIMDDIGSGITAAILVDGKIELLFSNEKFYEIHGYTRKEYNKRVSNTFDLIHPDDRQRVIQITTEAYETRRPVRMEYRITCPDGEEKWLRVGLSSTSLTGVDRNVHLCVFTDITAEKKAEQAYRDTTTLMKTLMDDTPGGFARLRAYPDGKMKPVYFNDGFCRLMGMERDKLMEVFGEDAMAGVHPDDVCIVNEAVEQMFRDGEAYSAGYRLRHGSGRYIWLRIFGRITKNASGEVFLNIYYTDATEQTKEEKQQRELLDTKPCWPSCMTGRRKKAACGWWR